MKLTEIQPECLVDEMSHMAVTSPAAETCKKLADVYSTARTRNININMPLGSM